jgi:MIP family channel proteins
LKTIWQQAIAEFFGTFALVFIGAGAVVVSGATGGVLPVAIAHGLVLAVMVTNLGHISGGHFNPAVTVGVWVAGKIETMRAAWYIVVQLAGAAAGAGLLRLSIPDRIWKASTLGATLVSHQATTSGRAVLLEAVLTFFLVFTVFATAVDDRGAFKSIAGFGIGLVLAFDILVGGPFTGASMNPARSFGPALLTGHWTDFWVYVAGPLSGGIIASAVYWLAFLRDREVYAPREDVPIGGGPEEDLPGGAEPETAG